MRRAHALAAQVGDGRSRNRCCVDVGQALSLASGSARAQHVLEALCRGAHEDDLLWREASGMLADPCELRGFLRRLQKELERACDAKR